MKISTGLQAQGLKGMLEPSIFQQKLKKKISTDPGNICFKMFSSIILWTPSWELTPLLTFTIKIAEKSSLRNNLEKNILLLGETCGFSIRKFMKHFYQMRKARALYTHIFCKGYNVTAGINKFETPMSTPYLKIWNHICIFQDK